MVPKPALVPAPVEPSSNAAPPVVPAEIPLPATDTETNGSYLSVPLTDTPSASVAPADTIIKSPANPETKDQEFAAPKELSSSGSTKVRRKSRPRSRSSSSRNSEPSQVHRPQGVSPSDSLTNTKRVRGIGRGKAKEAANSMPMPSSIPLTGATLPRENLRITIPAGGGQRKVEIVPDYPANIAHLAKLEDETRGPEEAQLSSTIKTDFAVQLPQDDPQEDSEIDILTGEIKGSKTVPTQFSFQALSILEAHQRFAQEVLKLEPDSWDRTKVEGNPSLFYHAYFLDQQKLSEVRQKGTVRIQQFNVKVTRQSSDKDVSASSRFEQRKIGS